MSNPHSAASTSELGSGELGRFGHYTKVKDGWTIIKSIIIDLKIDFFPFLVFRIKNNFHIALLLTMYYVILLYFYFPGHCKDCKNFNSLFAIISGLGHGCVSRLRSTWDKVPAKYVKMFEDLQDLMDPSRNMSKYRNLVSSEQVQPPMVRHRCSQSSHCADLSMF